MNTKWKSASSLSIFWVAALLGLAGWLAQPAVAGEKKAKRLIEFGWDEPDTAFMRQHIAEMEQTPFDGCVFHVNYRTADGKQGNFTWEGWGKRAFTAAELKSALADLQAIRFRHFKQNFLRFNTTPADLDWFDDHSPVLQNARLAAQFARQGKCPGLLFDIEQYNGQLFDYRKQRDVKIKSWELYSAQVRRRGREIMAAFQEGFPNLTVFFTFGYSLPWAESQAGQRPLAECHYGLLAPFLDGMLQAARGKVRLVDGHELSYGYRDTNRFATAYRTMKEGLRPIVHDPQKYEQFFSLGFGLWLDHDWRKLGWEVGDVSKNFYSPEAFGASARRALEVADEYVWIYSETPRWWSADGQAVKLPEAYVTALRKARRGLARD